MLMFFQGLTLFGSMTPTQILPRLACAYMLLPDLCFQSHLSAILKRIYSAWIHQLIVRYDKGRKLQKHISRILFHPTNQNYQKKLNPAPLSLPLPAGLDRGLAGRSRHCIGGSGKGLIYFYNWACCSYLAKVQVEMIASRKTGLRFCLYLICRFLPALLCVDSSGTCV